MDTVRIGLLGAGMISQKHLNMYAQIPEAQVVAVCSRTQQSAERCAQQFGIPLVFAKKSRSSNLPADVYATAVHSYTHGNAYTAAVAKEYIRPDDRFRVRPFC